MKLEEMEQEEKSLPSRDVVTRVDSCSRPKADPPYLFLIDKGDGSCEYQILTEDGRLVPAEKV